MASSVRVERPLGGPTIPGLVQYIKRSFIRMITPINFTHSLTMTPPPTQLRAQSSPAPSESENIPLNADTSRVDLLKVTRNVLSDVQLISCDRVLEIARR